ncbi:subclass B1 metallo-beta-lactamase [Lewinella sp. JB7]|uniref:subclass B1 metallo-beta-lactamase n=1 Tax=Lewinella sp. JB7 TaxID=2962887 RepID=UPI0020C9F433|nr:subclass B1 metallo-beta-lactamase [Lewinella sp. JB7]MCP9234914.1 subclass B1 metallo-beta-lactamase [Lewinella sp. JB7]
MGIKFLLLLFVLHLPVLVQAQSAPPVRYQSPSLEIHSLTPTTFVHVSYLEVEGYGRVACNGVLYVSGSEAVVVDAPTDDAATSALLSWIDTALQARVTAVVATHFHEDCVGGLGAFHARGIPSYALHETIDRATAGGNPVPRHDFDSTLTLTVGEHPVINRYFGPGHTTDNIVTYVPEGEVLFGGCLVKSWGAGKGNLEDADVSQWSATIERIREAYPNVRHVVPGHGPAGGPELLDFTIDLFAADKQ